VQIITEGRGQHFDPDMVDVFLEIEDEFRQVALEFADFDEERRSVTFYEFVNLGTETKFITIF